MNIRATRLAHTTTMALALSVAAVFAGSALAADGTDMAKKDAGHQGEISVTESKTINAAPDEVWETVRDFDAISMWHPAVVSSDISKGENNEPGAQRHLTLGDGGTIDEQLVSWDDDGMSYSYKIIGGVLPVSNYMSTISVEAEGDEQSKITWTGHFDPAEGQKADMAREVITNVYRAGLVNVKTMMDGNDARQ